MNAKSQKLEQLIERNERTLDELDKIIQKLKKMIRKDKSKPSKPEVTCESCYRKGHVKQDCYLLNRGYMCYNCEQIGHTVKTCPTRELNSRKYLKRDNSQP